MKSNAVNFFQKQSSKNEADKNSVKKLHMQIKKNANITEITWESPADQKDEDKVCVRVEGISSEGKNAVANVYPYENYVELRNIRVITKVTFKFGEHSYEGTFNSPSDDHKLEVSSVSKKNS